MLEAGDIGAEVALTFRRGAFRPIFVEFDNSVSFTGGTVRASVKKHPGDSEPTLASFTVEMVTERCFWLKLTPEAQAALTYGADRGTSGKYGADRNAAASTYVWDCIFVDSLGAPTPLFYGPMHVHWAVTANA